MNRFFVLQIAAFFAVSCSVTALTPPDSKAPTRPNIIYILADDLGYGDLGCYGQTTLATPHIDRLATEGMRFTRHYAGSTVCAPSRGVLMTGLHTGHGRIRGNGNWVLPDTDLTLPKLLQTAGYRTACFGKYGLGKSKSEADPQRKGFDTFFGYVDTSHAHNFYPPFLIRNGERIPLKNIQMPGSGKEANRGVGVAAKDGRFEWAPGLIAEEMHQYLQAQKGSPQPFFLYYALNLPHANNEATKNSPLGHGMESPNYGEFAQKDWPDAEKGFAQFIRFVDDEVGRIVTAVQKLGLEENTLILFSSDNGPHAEGGHRSDFFRSNGGLNGIKRALTDGGIRVPFIARWPGKVKPQTVSEHVCGFQDVLPTLADLASTPVTSECDGLSMVPTLLGIGRQNQHPYLFWDFDEQGGSSAVLQWPWKLIHLKTGAHSKENPNRKTSRMEVQLFNLDQNPQETHNLASSEPERVQQLQKAMLEAYRPPTQE